MNIYKVKGAVTYLEPCDCENCEGHPQSDILQYEVEALNEEEAKVIALKRYEDKELSWKAGELKWDDHNYRVPDTKVIFIREVTEEILMLRMGQRPLWSLLQTA